MLGNWLFIPEENKPIESDVVDTIVEKILTLK